jgi:hypothetical protein
MDDPFRVFGAQRRSICEIQLSGFFMTWHQIQLLDSSAPFAHVGSMSKCENVLLGLILGRKIYPPLQDSRDLYKFQTAALGPPQECPFPRTLD